MAIEAAAISSRRDGLKNRIQRAQEVSPAFASFSKSDIYDFCNARNDITHNGFDSADHSRIVRLYIEVGLPLLDASYREFHSYNLFDGLLQEYAGFLIAAQNVNKRAKELQSLDVSYSLNPFGHLIRWSFKSSFSSEWELDAIIGADETGAKYGVMHKRKEALGRIFDPSWLFDCPICEEFESTVCQLDEAKLDASTIVPMRMGCAGCGFAVQEGQPFLSEILLQNQIAAVRNQILKEYGVV